MENAFYAFGTLNHIRINSQTNNHKQEEIHKEMQTICNNLDNQLSVFKPDSEISQINANAGIKPIIVSTSTFELLKRAQYFSKESTGAFDITIHPVVKLWSIGHKDQRVPEKSEIDKKKKFVNYKKLHLDEKNQTAFLEECGQSIDLGGIAKGYAVDLIHKELTARNVTSGLLNFGGTILAIGKKTDGTPWKVGIQNPLDKRGVSIGSVSLEDDVLVTSGVNERFFIQDGIRYHHILDPRTCKPSRSKVLSVTATGGCGMDLDGITTALFVLGIEKGILLARKIGLEALYLMENGEIISTRGFANGKYKFIPNSLKT